VKTTTVILFFIFNINIARSQIVKDTIILWISPPIFNNSGLPQQKAKVFTNCTPTKQDTLDFGEILDLDWYNKLEQGLQNALDSFRLSRKLKNKKL
jgi:hypothetical protein